MKQKVEKNLRSCLKFLAFLIFTLFYICLFSMQKTNAATIDEPFSVIIVAGQSNANGEKSYSSQITTPYPGLGDHPADSSTKMIWSMGNNLLVNTWNNSPAGQFKSLADTQPSGWFGPELGLVRNLYDSGRRNMVLIKVAYGGQLLSNVGSGLGFTNDWNVNSTNESYDKLVERINDALTLITNQGDTYTIDGFYWMQGESDAVKGGSHATNYETNLTDLINQLHNDFYFHPNAKNVLGKISIQYCLDNIWHWLNKPNGCNIIAAVGSTWAIANTGNINVRSALQNYANDHSDTAIVESEDLTRTNASNDWVHLIWSSELTLGSRMATSASLPYRLDGDDDYDGDGTLNNAEDTNSNGNLADDDDDSDNIPNYLDAPAPPPDTTPPTGSIIINGGASEIESLDVSLQISANDNMGISGLEMQISENSNLNGASWQAYSTNLNWTFSDGYGIKTIYLKLKDASSNESSIYSAQIYYPEPEEPEEDNSSSNDNSNSGSNQSNIENKSSDENKSLLDNYLNFINRIFNKDESKKNETNQKDKNSDNELKDYPADILKPLKSQNSELNPLGTDYNVIGIVFGASLALLAIAGITSSVIIFLKNFTSV